MATPTLFVRHRVTDLDRSLAFCTRVTTHT